MISTGTREALSACRSSIMAERSEPASRNSHACMLCDDDLMTCFLLQIESYEERMSEHGRFLIALSELDVPRVRQLVATALKAGRSISYIVDKLFDAANGLYRPKGYDDKELDLSFLVLSFLI